MALALMQHIEYYQSVKSATNEWMKNPRCLISPAINGNIQKALFFLLHYERYFPTNSLFLITKVYQQTYFFEFHRSSLNEKQAFLFNKDTGSHKGHGKEPLFVWSLYLQVEAASSHQLKVQTSNNSLSSARKSSGLWMQN